MRAPICLLRACYLAVSARCARALQQTRLGARTRRARMACCASAAVCLTVRASTAVCLIAWSFAAVCLCAHRTTGVYPCTLAAAACRLPVRSWPSPSITSFFGKLYLIHSNDGIGM
ncbi:UNVERIFIED_CONTAM: hypothetical protein Sradi_0731000 [Sesamum radiatum]|uniref:Uncharacterized protein n=1 Tax=Sesamum radiatum TaxID=300843 RepID=A0AAW2VNM3_SESRA